MATQTKACLKFQLSDWYTNGFSISTDGERQRNASFQIRQEGRFLRNETDNLTKWEQYDNTQKISDRIDSVRKWKELLEEALEFISDEILELSNQKDSVENSLEMKNMPTDVTNECLTTRDGRQLIDNVTDFPENELYKEQEIIAKAKKNLQQRIDEAFLQINVLKESRHQILVDLQDKNIALGVDIDQYNLNELSANISYKPDPLRIPKGSTNPQQWEDFTRYNIGRAQSEIGTSQRLREAMIYTVTDIDNDLIGQKNAVDYALRSRLHDLESALTELSWQKEQIEAEIDKLIRDLYDLENALRAKIPSQKLAETRLENRTMRPKVELCRDMPQYGLTNEVKQIVATKDALQEKIKQTRHALDALEKQLYRINDDISLKQRSLHLDRSCQQIRDRLNISPITQSDKLLNN